MNKLPVFHTNKKYWMILNKLVFGDNLDCPSCETILKPNYLVGYLWCGACRKKYRPTAHKSSWLYGLKLKPRQLFILLWCWQNRKSPDTARLLANVSYRTVQRWYERFRIQTPTSTGIVVGDRSSSVAIDESFFGRKRSRQAQEIVVGVIALDEQLRLQQVTKRDMDTLEAFVLDTVAAGSLILTDEWGGYNDISVHGYGHEWCNHSKGRFSGTNQIERVWSEIKRYLRKLYGCIPTKNLNSILKEWEARHNFPELFTNPINYLQVTLVPC